MKSIKEKDFMPPSKESQQPPSPTPWATWPFVFFIMLVLVTIGFRYAEPVKDGDLWWQMVYGRYLLENKTLIPDHTLFTWTPSTNETMYCAWISEIVLYLLYQIGGLPILFAFRYLCILLFVFLLWQDARQKGLSLHPLTWLICTLGVLMSKTAAFLKPEIFSYVFMTLIVYTFFYLKSSDETAWRRCYLIPLIMLIWVNSHGAFIFGLAFVFLAAFGELLNMWISPQEAPHPKLRKHLLISLLLCGLSVFITPYGWHYPLQLFQNMFLGGQSTEELQGIYAYHTIFEPSARPFHYPDYLVLSGLIFLLTLLPRLWAKRFDWSLIVTNVGFGALYVYFLRTTFFFVPIVAFSSLYLLSKSPGLAQPKKRWIRLLMHGFAVVLILLVSGREAYDARCKPYQGRWLGFGNSYQNPVEEAEFIKKNLSDFRLGNDYGAGGYLLWRLWPKMKIFIDPRYFPFKAWYGEYRDFILGLKVDPLIKRFPCDVWCIRHKYIRAINWFLRSREWKLVYYGPVAAVFVHEKTPFDHKGTFQTAEGLKEIKHPGTAFLAMNFATGIMDFDNALMIGKSLDKYAACPGIKDKIAGIQAYTRGIIAYHHRDYRKAVRHFRAANRSNSLLERAFVVNAYNQLAVAAWKQGDGQGALRDVNEALALNPEDPITLFNAGVLRLHAHRRLMQTGGLKGNAIFGGFGSVDGMKKEGIQYLNRFMQKAKGDAAFSRKVISIAQSLINGSYPRRPVLISPPEPVMPKK
jgi:tetratricopeptide (TPR) repeat protein